MTEPSKIRSFLTSFTRHGCFRGRKAACDRMLLAVRNIKSQRRALFCHKPHVGDLSLNAWLGSFYTSKHTAHTFPNQKEHLSDPRPLKFCLWEKCTFVHTCWLLTQSGRATQEVMSLRRSQYFALLKASTAQKYFCVKKSKWTSDCSHSEIFHLCKTIVFYYIWIDGLLIDIEWLKSPVAGV